MSGRTTDDDWQANTFDDLPAAVQDAAVTAAAKVVARFDEKRDSDVKKLGAERWALARIHAHVIADYAQMVKKQATDFSVRDRAMADNTLRLLEMLGPSGKLVLWAHNGHVQKRAIPPVKSQGHVLAEKLGKDYVVFGLAFDQGSFQAIDTDTGIRDFTVGAAPPGSLDGALAAAGLPLFAIDLRTATGPARTWLHTPTASRTIGSVFSARLAPGKLSAVEDLGAACGNALIGVGPGLHVAAWRPDKSVETFARRL
jgi:erythromycin esterase